MSKLEELEEELYGKEGEGELAKRMKRRVIFPGTLQKPSSFWQKRDKQAPGGGGSFFSFTPGMLRWFLGAISVLGLVLGAAILFLYLGAQGGEAKVRILAPERVQAGGIFTLPITITNISRVALKEAELSITLPEGSRIEEEGIERDAPLRVIKVLEDLARGEERTVEIRVRIFGKEGEQRTVEAALLYRPENVRARFTEKASKAVTVGSVPLAISWDFPETISSGQEITAKIRYGSNSSHPFQNISVRVDYPPGFELKSAEPSADFGNAVWKIGVLPPEKEGEIIIRGTLAGEEGEFKVFRAGIGIFNEFTKEWKAYLEASREAALAVTPLSVQGQLQGARSGIIAPGERIKGTIRWRNNTPHPLKNVTVRAEILGAVLDLGTLAVRQGGAFDASSRSMVWGPGGTSVLREVLPGAGGELEFEVSTRERPPMRSAADKNFIVRLISSIEAAGTPPELSGTDLQSRDIVEFKVRSKVIFAARALGRTSPIINSGPLPPKVGAKTTYTIVWEVRNFTSDLEEVIVRASLPPNIRWENKISPADAAIFYDPAASEVRWRIGKVGAGTGVITPALIGAFQVSVTPSEADAGEALTLVGESVASWRDTFTGEELQETAPAKSTELRDDPAVSVNEGRVAR